MIEAVFVELDGQEPEGFTDKVFRLDDGVIEHDDVEPPDSLQDLPVFQAFLAEISDRCDLPPLAMEATIVGGYR